MSAKPVRAAVEGSDGLVLIELDDQREIYVLVDDRRQVHRVWPVWFTVPAGENAAVGHQVRVICEYPADAPKPQLVLGVSVDCCMAAPE